MKVKINGSTPTHSNSMEINVSELPSQGIGYPKGLIFRIRPYTLGEVLNFSSSSISKETKILSILEGVTPVGVDYDLLNIFSVDLDALALLRYSISTESPTFLYTVVCMSCQQENSIQVLADEIQIQEVKVKPIQIRDLKFFLPTVGKILELSKKTGENDKDLYLFTLATYCLNDLPLEDIVDKLLNINYTDYRKLKGLIDEVASVGVQPITTQCKHCDEKVEFVPDLIAVPL